MDSQRWHEIIGFPEAIINDDHGSGARHILNGFKMKIFKEFTFVLLGLLLLGTPQAQAWQEEKTEQPKPIERFGAAEENQIDEKGKIFFTFKDQDYKDVIPWFAEQAGYSLQPVSEWPQNTFNLKEREGFTVVEALDQLNHALRRLRPEPYTLIRNRKMLILAKVSDANFPDDLIEKVAVEDLNERGKYETISCIFDLDDLDANEVYDQLEPLVSEQNERFYAVFPIANQIHVRETGANLRQMRDLISVMKSRRDSEKIVRTKYKLKHRDGEDFMAFARGLLNMPTDSNIREDGTLTIGADPFSPELYISGTQKAIEDFEEVAEMLDTPLEGTDDPALADKPYLVRYPVKSDSELAFATVQTMLEDRDDTTRMQQDQKTGAIVVLATKDLHDLVAHTLQAISGANDETFKVIPVYNRDAAILAALVQELIGQTAEETSGPVVRGDSVEGLVYVRGKPQEVTEVEGIIAKLEAESTEIETGPRSQTRMIEMDPRQQDEIASLLPDLLGSAGRTNSINVVRPKDRKDLRNRMFRNAPSETKVPEETELERQQREILEELQKGGATDPDFYRKNKTNPDFKTQWFKQVAYYAPAWVTVQLSRSLLTYQEEIGQTSDEQDPVRPRSSDYIPAPDIPTVPNSPIEAVFTEYGLKLYSKDLDALDDLESMIESRLSSTNSSLQTPQFFLIEFRPADEVLDFVNQFFGLSDSSGGGGGGGMLGGMVSNMMGGGDDLLGGLLGGDLGGGSGTATLEGDVSFLAYMPLNALVVQGASNNDLDLITELLEVVDRAEAPHQPNTIGIFRTIDVIHRDPAELKEKIQEHLGDLIDTGESSNPQNQQAREMAAMAKAVQQMTGGGKGGGQSSDLKEKRPKAKLDVDETTSQLLVTGPEYIYDKILEVVERLDVKELSTPLEVEIVPVSNGSAMLQALIARYGSQLEIQTEEMGATNGQPNGRQTPTSNKQTAANAARSTEAIRGMMMNAFRAQAQGGGQRGGGASGRGSGGQTRGGRGGAGGGRGGR
ncbi:MAG: hypothetical protein AAF939_07865 [Planctomycetota bacterium]